MAWAPLALSIVGTGMSVAGALSQANVARATGEYNAQLAEQNAVLAGQQAAEEERRFRVASRKQLGAMRAAYSASGVELEGTPMDVLAESAYVAELDALTIRRGGEASAAALQSQATLDRLYGRAQQQGGYYSAASELLSGAAGAYGTFKRT